MEFSYSQTENFVMEKLSSDTGYFKKPVEICWLLLWLVVWSFSARSTLPPPYNSLCSAGPAVGVGAPVPALARRTTNDNNKELLSKQLQWMMIDVSWELSVLAYHDTFRSRHVHTIATALHCAHC